MTNEEMQKAIEFIINHQGQFVVDVASLEAKLDGLTTAVAQLTNTTAQLAAVTLRRFEETDNRFEDVDRRISALVDAQIRTEENLKRTNEEMRNLIAVVDRYFSNGRNGE